MRQEIFKLTEEGQKDFRKKLSAAFRVLRNAGYIAKQNFWCCQSCAWSDIPDDAKKVVFYHHQDNDDIPDGYVYLAWRGSGRAISKALRDAGLKVSWNRSETTRIKAIYPIGG